MPLSKPRFNLSAINPEFKNFETEKRQDPFNNIFQQAMGKEPFVSFSRAGDNHLHLFQLLHALDQQGINKLSKGSKPPTGIVGKDKTQELRNDFAGWPLSLPSKLQMQKCDKCSREFFSPINYRRHIRIHRRSLHIDKDSSKSREYLASFWDKLPLEEATEITSFKNVVLEDVPGSSIIKTLTSFVRKPTFISLPQFYVKAGAAILDIIQSRPSKLPISSKDLFAILDDASEQTFLCAGTAASMQRFVFDGEAAKIGLELRNIVACTSFLIEQKLVAAWLADKDAEALRCQKLLVEEEEAAQKRQAELSEKRRLKKLRHKEQKQRDHGDDGTTNDTDALLGPVDDASTLVERPISPVPAVLGPECVGLSCESICPLEPAITTDADGLNNAVNTVDLTDQTELEVMRLDDQNGDPSGSHAADQNAARVFGKQHFNMHVRQTVRHLRYLPNGFNSGFGAHSSSVSSQKLGGFKDQKMTPKHKVWAIKSNMEKSTDVVDKGRGGVNEQPQESKKCEVLIGSISVAISECEGLRKDGVDIAVAVEAHHVHDCTDQRKAADQQATNRNPAVDKRRDSDCDQTCPNQPKLKLWRPVGVAASGREEAMRFTVDKTDGSSCDQRKESTDCAVREMADCSATKESCNILPEIEREAFDTCTSLDDESAEGDAVKDAGLMFSSREAEMFLKQRWKEAISGEHTTVVTSQDAEMSFVSTNPLIASAELIIPDGSAGEPEPVEKTEDFNSEGRTVLASTENQMMAGETDHCRLDGVSKPRSQSRSVGKINCVKYIPKQKNMHR